MSKSVWQYDKSLDVYTKQEGSFMLTVFPSDLDDGYTWTIENEWLGEETGWAPTANRAAADSLEVLDEIIDEMFSEITILGDLKGVGDE